MGKGSKSRVKDLVRYRIEWERIFGRKRDAGHTEGCSVGDNVRGSDGNDMGEHTGGV